MGDTAIYGVFGAGGFGRETMPAACAMLAQKGVDPHQVVFTDDGDVPDVINGYSVFSSKDFLDYPVHRRYFNVTIANSVIRKKLVRQLIRNSKPDRKITIGRAAVIGMGAIVTKSVPAGTTVAGNPAMKLERV